MEFRLPTQRSAAGERGLDNSPLLFALNEMRPQGRVLPAANHGIQPPATAPRGSVRSLSTRHAVQNQNGFVALLLAHNRKGQLG